MTIRHDDRHDRGLEYDLSTLIARRRILGILGGLGAGAVLAGCGAPEREVLRDDLPARRSSTSATHGLRAAKSRDPRRDRGAVPR